MALPKPSKELQYSSKKLNLFHGISTYQRLTGEWTGKTLSARSPLFKNPTVPFRGRPSQSARGLFHVLTEQSGPMIGEVRTGLDMERSPSRHRTNVELDSEFGKKLLLGLGARTM
jgi:hypothetical protein